MVIDEKIARRLKYIRVCLDMTRKECAELLEVDILTYRRLESGGHKASKKIVGKVMAWISDNYGID